jgi:hypothetical protein
MLSAFLTNFHGASNDPVGSGIISDFRFESIGCKRYTTVRSALRKSAPMEVLDVTPSLMPRELPKPSDTDAYDDQSSRNHRHGRES